MILSFIQKSRVWLLLALIVSAWGCGPEAEPATAPADLALMVDKADVTGEATSLNDTRGQAPLWQEIFREDFTEQTWPRWTPAPNQVPPVVDDPKMLQKWTQAVERLKGAATVHPETSVLEIGGSFDLQWVGYVVPVKVRGGRQYRISARVKTGEIEGEGLQRIGFVGFLELDRPLEQKASYSASEIAPHIIADQKSPGSAGAEDEWRDESFTLTLNEETETLFLYVCAYHGGKVEKSQILFDHVIVEELSLDPLADYLQYKYLTPWSSRVEKHGELFKVAGWGNPTEMSHHLEGLVSPGESNFSYTLDGREYAEFAFWYGPLPEFSSETEGRLSFVVEVNGEQIFEDHYDFSKDEGKQGWRRKTLPLEGALETVVLKTRSSKTDRNVTGFWGTPRLLPVKAKQARNVLIICVDSLRKDFVKLYGGVDAMPIFSSLAEDGRAYENYISAGNTTRYALTALMTGQYAGRNGLYLNSVYDQLALDFRQQFASRVPTLPGWFRDHGYSSSAIIDNPFFLPVTTGLHMGFAEVYNIGSDEEGYSVITDRAIDLLGQQDGQAFFTFVHYDPDYIDKLTLVGQPGPDANMLRTAYFLELEAINREIERLVDALRGAGRYDTTDILLISDHGESLDPELTGHGYHLNPDQVIVPLVVKPSLQAEGIAGNSFSGAVSSVDLAPWLIKEHGLDAPEGFVGLAGAVDGETTEDRTIFSEGINQHQLLVLKADGTYLLHKDGRESLFGKAMVGGGAASYRRQAIDFMASARPGLYLSVASEEQPSDVEIDSEGLNSVQVIGRTADDRIGAVSERVSLSLQAGGPGRVLFFPEEGLTYPCRLIIRRQGDEAMIGLSPDFLPTERGELIIENAEQLHRLSRPSAPTLTGKKGAISAWYSQGGGVRAISSEQKQLDPAMRSMLQRWGYIK